MHRKRRSRIRFKQNSSSSNLGSINANYNLPTGWPSITSGWSFRSRSIWRRRQATRSFPSWQRKIVNSMRCWRKWRKKLFNDVLANKYAPDGRFSMKLLRDDAQQLAHEVAGIYQELSDQPLLNTNMEDVLRSSSRVCLQMLTLLDQLPGDVKKHNIENLYAYVRRAVGAYGVYRKAEPYWGYVNGVYYLGRLALGAHPVSMGAWWLAGQVSRRATKQITAKYVNRQVLALLNETIRVLGYEVANLYGAGFRYRDANWIYAA